MASFIEGVRTRRSLSQADLARKIGVTQQSVSKWEAGTASPRGEQLAQLNEALDIAPAEWEDLLAGLDELEACGPCGGLRRVRRWQSGGRIASMADVALACPQCGRRWFVPAELAYGPTAQQVDRAARKAKHATRTSRKRKRFEVGLMADQSARATQARRCPRCGAGGVDASQMPPPVTAPPPPPPPPPSAVPPPPPPPQPPTPF